MAELNTNTAPVPTADNPTGLSDLARLNGLTLDQLRRRVHANPRLKALFVRIGSVYVAPASALPVICAMLKGA